MSVVCLDNLKLEILSQFPASKIMTNEVYTLLKLSYFITEHLPQTTSSISVAFHLIYNLFETYIIICKLLMLKIDKLSLYMIGLLHSILNTLHVASTS